MRLIISPAKQMRVDTDTLACDGLPVFLDRTETLKDCLNSLTYDEQKKLWACNEKIARENHERFLHMDLCGGMVRYAAEIAAETPEQLRSFTVGNYRYDEARSTDTEYVFIRAAAEEER